MIEKLHQHARPSKARITIFDYGRQKYSRSTWHCRYVDGSSRFSFFVFNTELTTALARTEFILLFLVLVIGPVTKLKRPSGISSPLSLPWSWRGELGIWFAITALTHFILHWVERPLLEMIKIGGSGYSLANVIGLVALVITLILAATSLQKVIIFIGTESWRWLHSMTYVVFYLVLAHFAYFQLFSTRGEVGPDWFGYVALVMGAIVIILHISAFIAVTRQHKTTAAGLRARKEDL